MDKSQDLFTRMYLVILGLVNIAPSPPPNPDRPIVPVSEALTLLGNAIPRSTFNAMLNRGEVDARKIGNRWYVRTAWIFELLDRFATGPE
jgi:hypothetical protein